MKPLNQEITNENKEEERKRHQIADNAFGPNPQPVLERVEFKVRLQFCLRVPLLAGSANNL